MPSVPIEIPSDTVIVLNKTALQFDSSIDCSTISAKSLICMLQGVTFDQVEATPTNGFLKSSEENPTPLSIDLEAACNGPSTNLLECFLLVIFNQRNTLMLLLTSLLYIDF